MKLDKENIKKLMLLIVFTVAVVAATINYTVVLSILGFLWTVILPLIIGGVIAFVLNVPMRAVERILPIKKKKKLARGISLVFALLLVAAIIAVAVIVVIPQLIDTLVDLGNSFPHFLNTAKNRLVELFSRYPEISSSYPEITQYISGIQINWESLIGRIAEFLSHGANSILSSTVSVAISIVSGVFTFVVSFIFALYILIQKETLAENGKRLLAAFLPDKIYEKTVSLLTLTESTFSHFLTGQCLEALILGAMFVVTLMIFRLPYAMLIGVLIAFTALIPIFGTFIGCAIATFLIFTSSPMQALYFLIIFIVLQQIEGNLIYPHVVGSSIGLPSIWVLFAVTVGGGMFGVIGMLVFIPLCSVLYTVLRSEVNKRLERKKAAVALSVPAESAGFDGEGVGDTAEADLPETAPEPSGSGNASLSETSEKDEAVPGSSEENSEEDSLK